MEVDALDAVAPREKSALVEHAISALSMAATRYAYVDFQKHGKGGRGQNRGTPLSPTSTSWVNHSYLRRDIQVGHRKSKY